MNDEIETAPGVADRVERVVDRRFVRDIALHSNRRADSHHKRPKAFFEILILIGEGEFGAVIGQGLRDAPGYRMVIRDAHDEPALALHKALPCRHSALSPAACITV